MQIDVKDENTEINHPDLSTNYITIRIKVDDIDDTAPEFLNSENWKFVVAETDDPVNLTQKIVVQGIY